MSKTHKKFVIVGLSGGVDSSVSALLLKNEGYHVEAVFMQNWHDSESNDCTINQDLHDAQAAADFLKIKLHIVNFATEYWEKVFQYFLSEHASCRTPNPDVLCNKEIKFKVFLEHAKSLGADFMATGHYARLEERNGKKALLKATDQNKDQTYFLHLLDQNQLSSTIFPIGNISKPEIRKIAEEVALPNHAKKDSTGICFIGERKFNDFLGEYLLERPGNIVTTDGETVGQHKGLMFYTIGQRQGIGIGGIKNFSESPWYVVTKDTKNNDLIVTQDNNNPKLFSKHLSCKSIHWISGEQSQLPLKCSAKIRHRQPDQECVVSKSDSSDHVQVTFSESQRAIAPGQSVVFYNEDECLGGGIIM